MASVESSRPTLLVQTVAFHDNDAEDARKVGLALYNELTRPLDDPLAFGGGIPVLCNVHPDRVDFSAAEIVVTIPVLGGSAFHYAKESTVLRIQEWHQLCDEGRVLPLPIDDVWRNAEGTIPGTPLLTQLYEADDVLPGRATIDEIVLALYRQLRNDRPSLFVSHAKADLKATQNAAKRIAAFGKTQRSGIDSFFDRTELMVGKPLDEQIEGFLEQGVFVAVRGDNYSSRVWCQREVLHAKKNHLPTLTVEVLCRGERRSSAYGGNGPTVVWGDVNNEEQILSKAMIEALRAAHFEREAERVASLNNLPKSSILTRPPELLDLMQGPLKAGAPQLVMYPDPELPVLEHELLRSANPRLRLVTPLTAFRHFLQIEDHAESEPHTSSPLSGFKVALSLSNSPDVDQADGFSEYHVQDVIVQIARAMVSTGAAIVYGGDQRRGGYTLLLAELIAAYNQTAANPAELLINFLAAIEPTKLSPGVPVTLSHLAESDNLTRRRILPPEESEQHPAAMYYSDMRRIIAQEIDAQILVGGKTYPKLHDEDHDGYSGLYPGIVEEAWRALEQNLPLYAVGGYGGAAELVAILLGGGSFPEALDDTHWRQQERYRNNAEAILADHRFAELNLPHSMEELAQAIRERGTTLLASSKSSRAWNGLSVAENRMLFDSRDPVLINTLIMKGLLAVARKQTEGKLSIELVYATVKDAVNLDAIAIATFADVPLGGAGAALDDFAVGLFKEGRMSARPLVGDESSHRIDADWVLSSSLGEPAEPVEIFDKICGAAEQCAEFCQRFGLERLGVVTFGGRAIGDSAKVVEAMLSGLALLGDRTQICWFESKEHEFEKVEAILRKDPKVHLTTRRVESSIRVLEPSAEPFVVHVTHSDDGLTVATLPPSSSPVGGLRRTKLSEEQIGRLASGSGDGRNTPTADEIARRGDELADMLFGADATELLSLVAGSRFVVAHDISASKLPFECLRSITGGTPATFKGLTRCLIVPGLPSNRMFGKAPRTTKLRVLLVVDPTGDLEGARREGNVVEKILDATGAVEAVILHREDANRETFAAELERADLLHYCGHAFFDGPGETESGLVLSGKEEFRLAELAGLKVPRVAIFNACEAGRVRGYRGEPDPEKAASFAEFFLRGGVESYLGTFWRVGDLAAAMFAERLYGSLAAGESLLDAVTAARCALRDHQPEQPDWANYLLYGDGRFRLRQ
ncbi:CHAT domain-containing protein [Stratiformator vulcanicus]|uniref:CHAT domain protein n=1 Tax=Stratiformator vulcanicus TaxID=2527980 RepID=A0A517QWK7_9PLAN|nr:CHAT domain-containing protein [Stratiformator vulcanicus]QDT35963.1 CHAT domain protein [Stratiformator vulcanicus]